MHYYLGVDSFDVSLEKQEVIVNGSASYDDVLATIKKTGKEVSGFHPFVKRGRHPLLLYEGEREMLTKPKSKGPIWRGCGVIDPYNASPRVVITVQ